MLKTKEMLHVAIIGPRAALSQAVEAMHSLRLIHIRDWDLSAGEGFQKGSPLGPACGCADSLVSFRSLVSQLGIGKLNAEPREPDLPVFRALESKVLACIDSIRARDARLKEIDSSLFSLEPFRALGIDLDYLKGYASVSVFTGFAKSDVSPRISGLTPHFELFSCDFRGKRFIALFVPNDVAGKAADALQDSGFDAAGIPAFQGSPSDAYARLCAEREKVLALAALDRLSLASIKGEYAHFLASGERYLTIETDKAEAPLRFLFSKNAFVLDAFVPTGSFPTLESSLSGLCHVSEFSEEVPERQVPVSLDNPSPARPYESLIGLFTLPRYGESDPTVLMFIFFPLFFGFMLGDIGYGIVTLVLFTILKFRVNSPGWQSLFTILIYSSITTIAFGFVFGEFFGLEEIGHYKLPHLFVRMTDIIPILLTSVGIGVLHLNVGYLVGFSNVLRQHGLVHAVKEKASWMFIQASVALIALSYMKLISLPIYAGVGALVFSFALLIMGEGMIGAIEVLGLLSNILSYSRLLAIGLSSVAIAFVVNMFAGAFYAKGGVYLVFMALLLLIGHGANILIGAFGSFLHSLRLHYVEFFSKFYAGGGTKYLPFGKYEEV